MNDIALSPEETKAVEQILKTLSRGAKYPFSVDGLMRSWISFVIALGQEYDSSIYEYANDLAVRDILETILRQAPPSVEAKLLPHIKPWDERFQQLTASVDRPIVPGVRNDAAPWWFRIPVMPGAELDRDLRSEGLIT